MYMRHVQFSESTTLVALHKELLSLAPIACTPNALNNIYFIAYQYFTLCVADTLKITCIFIHLDSFISFCQTGTTYTLTCCVLSEK
jgi:hypothetical protein